jgi:hypothetical protein
MSSDETLNEAGKRLSRLKAMKAKHVQRQPTQVPVAPPSETPVGKPDLMGRLHAAMAQGQGGGQGGRAAILQKVRQALSGPDGKIDPNRARMLLSFIHKQAADPNAPRHELAKRVEGMLNNMPPQQRQKLMAVARLSEAGLGSIGGPNRSAGAIGAGSQETAAAPQDGAAPAGEPWFDNLLSQI